MNKVKPLVILLAVVGFMVAASASVQAETVTLLEIGDGTAKWVETTSAVGVSSLELYWPKPGSNYAGVGVTDLGDPMVKDFDSWSYWAKAPEDYIPNFVISLDTPLENYAGRDYDTNVNIWPSNDDHGDEWLEFFSSMSLPYVIWQQGSSSPIMKSMTWPEFQEPFSQWGKNFDFSEAVVKQIRIWNGGIGTTDFPHFSATIS